MAVSTSTKSTLKKNKNVASMLDSSKEAAIAEVYHTPLEPHTSVVSAIAALAGKYDDEPLWDDYLAAIQAYRQECNEQEKTLSIFKRFLM